MYPAYPNPFNGSVRIPYSLAHSGRYALDIYTVGRQRIRRLAGGESRAGHYEAVWDGRDAVGGKVAAGLYVAFGDWGRVRDDALDPGEIAGGGPT